MSEIVSKFEICSKIPEYFRENIKSIHVFDERNGKNVIFVTKEDKVYAFGNNYSGVCGFGHNRPVEEPQEVPELSHKNIKRLFIRCDFILALSADNRMYGWGVNYCGQLGRFYTSKVDEYLKPEMISWRTLRNKNIEQVCSGNYHAHILTADGTVYGWGFNGRGIVGCGRESGDFVPEITELKVFRGIKVKSIHCYGMRSFVITNDGQVYSWGDGSGLLGHILDWNQCLFEPKLITNITNVKAVCLSVRKTKTKVYRATYFLTFDGHIYFCGYMNNQDNDESVEIKNVPTLVDCETKFVELRSVRSGLDLIASALTEDAVYSLDWKTINKTNYKSFLDYYSNEFQLSHKTIQLIHKYNINRLSIIMSKAFNNPKNCDIKFRLRRKQSEDIQDFDYIYSHKWFLEEVSQYFKKMFANSWIESDRNEIEINSYSYEAFHEYLKSLYSDFIECQDMEVLLEMLAISEEHLDTEFKDKCSQCIKPLISDQNVYSVYSFAVKFRAKELEEFCFELIVKNKKQIVLTKDFESMDEHIAKYLLTRIFSIN